MRAITQLLPVSLVLAGLLSTTAGGQGAWYYHVKTGGTGGQPVQSESDPGLSSCWSSINAAFAAVKSRAAPGPWIIQVDDEATYEEAVALFDFQTSSTETLTLTKAPWLAGTPTIYPSQPKQRALAINGLWPGSSDPLPDQPGQPSRRVTYVTVRGFTLKNNAQGTDKTTEQPVFTDNQTYLTDGLHIIEDCHFDGQHQVYDSFTPILTVGTCINTVFRRNVFQNFKINEDSADNFGVVFVVTEPVSTVAGEPQVTVADNTFHGNTGLVCECQGDVVNKRYYKLVFERNTVIGNSSTSHGMVTIVDCPLSNIVRNNIFWPTPGCYCIDVGRGCTENLISANNAFFTDWNKDGYPPGSAFSTTENTEVVGFWNNVPMTTSAWNSAAKKTSGKWSFFQSASMNNTGNGYTLGGPGLDKNGRLIAGSLCIDRGVPGLVSEDIDGGPRPLGGGYDIGAVEYRTTAKAGSPGGKGRGRSDLGRSDLFADPLCHLPSFPMASICWRRRAKAPGWTADTARRAPRSRPATKCSQAPEIPLD